MRTVFVLGLSLLAAMPSWAAGPVVEIERSNPVYKAVLVKLTPAVSEHVGLPVRLAVTDMRMQDEFAFVSASVTHPDGSDIDFKQTSYADAVASGMFDGPNLWAYLKQIDGQWTVLEQDIGPTDAWFAYWPEAHGGSCELTGLSQDC